MKTLSLSCILFFLSGVCFAQSPQPVDLTSLANEIELNSKKDINPYIKMRIQDSLLELQRFHYELISYRAKYALSLVSPDTNERIIIYKRIRNFPFYTVHAPYYDFEFSDLYIKATRDLIYLYERLGKLEELQQLNIVPSTVNELYGQLRIAIERMGGKWDRGEFQYPKDMIDRIKKNRN